MAVYAPGDSPPAAGGDQGGFLSWLQGLAPEAQSAIMRTMNYANPVQPAAADTLNQAPNPLNNPTPVPAALQGGGPSVPDSLVGHGDGPPPPPPAVVGAPPAPVTTNAPPAGSILPQARGVMPVMGPPQSPTPWFTGSNTPYTPNSVVGAPPPPPIHPAVAAAIAGGAVSPAARAQAPTVAAPAQGSSPFVPLNYRPNADVAGGALSRGGPPQMTALDLSGLFGGRGQPATAAARPAAAPSPTGRSPGMRITGDLAAAPPGRTQMTPDQLSAAVSKPGWWKGLGNKDMTPDQLARAVRKPNWYQNV